MSWTLLARLQFPNLCRRVTGHVPVIGTGVLVQPNMFIKNRVPRFWGQPV